jgi:hypothetical protein
MSAPSLKVISKTPADGRFIDDAIVSYGFDDDGPAMLCENVVLSNRFIAAEYNCVQSYSGAWSDSERNALHEGGIDEICLVGSPAWIDATARALDGATRTPLSIVVDKDETDIEQIYARLESSRPYEWREFEGEYFEQKAAPKSRAADLKSRLVTLRSIRPILTQNHMVKGWLGAGALSMVYGPSNAGKTFVALDMALHIAAGKPWRDCKTFGGNVLYIAAEGGSGVLNRLAAFNREKPDMASAPFNLLPTCLDLHSNIDAAAICEILSGEKWALIVIDTLARSMGSGDENTAKDAAAFVRNCDLIREATDAHVMVIHHTGKDEERGARGSSALRAAVDTEIHVSSKGEIICRKQRDMAMASPLHFELRSVYLGKDEDGEPVTSAVVDSAITPTPVRKPLTGKKQVAMSALCDAMRDHGQAMHGDSYPHDCKAVHIDHWRKSCADHGITTGATADAARMAFKRAKDALIEEDEVRIYGDYVWRVNDGA